MRLLKHTVVHHFKHLLPFVLRRVDDCLAVWVNLESFLYRTTDLRKPDCHRLLLCLCSKDSTLVLASFYRLFPVMCGFSLAELRHAVIILVNDLRNSNHLLGLVVL
jgi:hypothetical protein